MHFLPNEIFNEQRYRQLISDSTSDDRCNLAQIKSSARRNIRNDELWLYDSNNDIDRTFPPFGVEPICVENIKINFKVSKANDKNAF